MKAYIYLSVWIWVLIYCKLPVQAQKEATHWYFGPKLGLNFTNGQPEVLRNSAMSTSRGCAAISDKNTGELLFYSNGRNVWNRLHQQMPASHVFPKDCSNSIVQGALIVPVPGSEHEYYLFNLYRIFSGEPNMLLDCYYTDFGESIVDPTASDSAYYFQLRYSVIDMRLDGGRGDIVSGKDNLFLQNNLSTKLTAVPHTNGKDYWLMVHSATGNAFYTYLLSQTSIGQPIEQRIGSAYRIIRTTSQTYFEYLGEMKTSPDGKKLACAVYNLYERPFDVFDFDAATGTISNYQNFGEISQQMGVSFSPDNSKLYITSSNSTRRIGIDQANYFEIIRQYDFSLPTTGQVIASGKSIVRFNPRTNISEKEWPVNVVFNTLHIAPDGKIYGRGEGGSSAWNQLLIISRPNLPGFECGINMKYFAFDPSNERWDYRSLPNFMQSYFNNIPALPDHDSDCTEPKVKLYPNPAQEKVYLHITCQYVPVYVEIIDYLGRIVSRQRPKSNNDYEIETGGLASGMHIVRIWSSDTDQKPIVNKLVKW